MLTVFVSGCFDMLHAGHVRFLQRAAEYGDQLVVALGSDQTISDLKGRPPIYNEQERVFLVESLRCVDEVVVSSGSGWLDFRTELASVKPDVFVVNVDGDIIEKRALCQSLGIQYVVLDLGRVSFGNAPPPSTSLYRQQETMPYRIDLCGGWLDQPYVNEKCSGGVITLSIEPTISFNERSGMATSTRRHALELWGTRLPDGDPLNLAKTLFRYDNPPGHKGPVSGAQDAIGIVYPGLAFSFYENGEYWPAQIKSVTDDGILDFVQESLYLVPMDVRPGGYDPLVDTAISTNKARELSVATRACWNALLKRNIEDLGKAMQQGFNAQVSMFPHMMTDEIGVLIERWRKLALGWKVSGAGGGGYLVLVSRENIQGGIKIYPRRK